MLKILSLSLLFALTLGATRKPSCTVPVETINRLQKLYPEQSEAFIIERINHATSAFLKWRAFPSYFYELMNRSEGILGADFHKRQGLCAGDAHVENFGFLYSKKPKFSLNDLDDASHCALNVDAMRLFIGHRLVGAVGAKEWLDQYKAGLNGEEGTLPSFLKELEEESTSKKNELPKKYKKIFTAKVCDGEFSAVTAEETKFLTEYVAQEKKELSFACSRTKDSGGSAGNKRYIFFSVVDSKTEAVELKPLTHPSPLYSVTLTEEERKTLFVKAVEVFFGAEFSAAYFPVKLEGKLYLRRPLIGGNVDVKADDMNTVDLKEVSLYEARTLGRYHRLTNNLLFPLRLEAWDKMATEMEKKWRGEFAE